MSIARCITVVGSLYALRRQALGLNVATPLGAQELSCTVAPDRRLVVLGHEPIAGFERTHGTVADEAAMLALHTLDSTTLSISPRFVAPGDSVLRTDDPGWRWHCISGHGQSLSDWERRPLAGALAGLSVSGNSHEISAITGLQSALDGKQASSANLTAIANVVSTATGRALLSVATPAGPKIPQLNADGSVTAVDMPSGGGSSVGASIYTSSTQSIPATTTTAVQWHVEDHDDGGCADLSTHPTRLTVPAGAGGRYLLGYTILWAAQETGGRQAWIAANRGGTRHAETSVPARTGGGTTSQASTALLTLAAGDYVEVMAYQNSDAALNLYCDAYGSRSCAYMRRVG